MQEKLTTARPYAAAAFAYAREHDSAASWSAALSALALAVTEPTLAGFIKHPRVTGEQLLDVLCAVLGPLLSEPTRNFLRALVESERLELAPQIALLFERLRAEAEGVVEVEVSSAYPLSDAEKTRIDTAVRARMGKHCTIDDNVDPNLIGGVVIKIGDSVIDLSLRGRLSALEQQIA